MPMSGGAQDPVKGARLNSERTTRQRQARKADRVAEHRERRRI